MTNARSGSKAQVSGYARAPILQRPLRSATDKDAGPAISKAQPPLEFRDILDKHGLDSKARHRILLLRHRPYEPRLARAMPMMIAEQPELFETYQSIPGRPAASLRRAELVASFIGLQPGTAHFVGLYRIGASRALDFDAFWAIPGNRLLRDVGYEGFTREKARALGTVMQFDLELLPFCQDWRGKLVIDYPPPERSWFRWIDRGVFPVRSILEESAFTPQPPAWDDIDLTYGDLLLMPRSWRARIAEWRGIYLIFDEADGKSYVGSAYGRDNILGRWQAYARNGHGGNRELRDRDPRTFRFTLLERLAPDLAADEVIQREVSWKRRLHSRAPFGLNAN